MIPAMDYPISRQALYAKISDAILEALRSGVPIDIIHEAISHAQREVAIAAPLIAAAKVSAGRTAAREARAWNVEFGLMPEPTFERLVR